MAVVTHAVAIPLFLLLNLPSFKGQTSHWMLTFGLVPLRKNLDYFHVMIKKKLLSRLINSVMPREYGGKVTRLKLFKVIKSLGMNFAKFLEPIIFLLVLSLSRGKNFSS